MNVNSNLTGARSAVRKIVATMALVACFLAMPKQARAGSLGADIIGLFPKNVGEFA